MIEITQFLKSSPDRIDNMSASVHAGSELDFQQFGSVSREAKIKKFGFFKSFLYLDERSSSLRAEIGPKC